MTTKTNEKVSVRVAGTCAEYCQAAGISLNSLRAALDRGDVRHIRLGKRILIPRIEFDRLLGVAA